MMRYLLVLTHAIVACVASVVAAERQDIHAVNKALGRALNIGNAPTASQKRPSATAKLGKNTDGQFSVVWDEQG